MKRLAMLKTSSILISCLLILFTIFIITGCEQHYKVYTTEIIELPIPITVNLQDQFYNSPAALLTIDFFANPAEKNNKPISDPRTHLTWYRLVEDIVTIPRRVDFKNQFGEQTIIIQNADYLLVPTEKNNEGKPDNGKHFKCYRVLEAVSTQKQVTLKDQFNRVPITMTVGAPRFFCTPVQKNNEPIGNKETHLACYNLTQVSSTHQVNIMNQFTESAHEPLILNLQYSSMLCVESRKLKVEELNYIE